MNKTTINLLSLVALNLGFSHAATVVWDNDSADNSWQTAANWDNDTVPGSAADITIGTGDAVSYTPGGDLVVNGGGSLTINGGSSWTQTATNWSQINDGTLVIDNGTFTRTGGGNLVLALNSGDSGIANLTNSSISVGGELWFGHNSNINNQTAQMTLMNSSIDANGSVGIWFWDTDATGSNMSLNIVGAGSTVEGRVGRRNTGGSDNAVTWETLWDEGTLQFNGSNAGNFSDHFMTTGTAGTVGYTLTSVPEPSSVALFGLGGIALILRRRK